MLKRLALLLLRLGTLDLALALEQGPAAAMLAVDEQKIECK
jgi:hypothetical protein